MEINKFYNEDNLKTMNKMPNNFIDLIITSPPYNIFNTKAKDRGYDYYEDNKTNDQYIDWTVEIFNKFNDILKTNGIVAYNMSYGTNNTDLMNLTIAEIIKKTEFSIADIIVWKKNTALPNSPSKNRLTRICEFVYIFSRKNELNTFNSNKKVINEKNENTSFYESIENFITAKNNDESNELNKATYSTELVRKILKIYSKKDNLIYDPFMGTGTTAIASIIEKCNFIGSELSNKQVEYSEKRLKKFQTQQTLF